ncbi:hypothetical protein PF010_g22090 [Phytophthora fragariae]|uniref:Myb-like domain-containing protein n=2 Tax=Phytophthora TaxID=4783 RepID=A0A6G0QA27_9STRA|nr:hypothetical protein PR002_g15088 [Phytophthora rubi]KAE9081182.1 hypothetical protein PF010_g22090 [Phytophthora fragariae]KAE9016297.1 hypothetical protein PR001_g14692 [Phytophthora rubi]KAE9191513.1 hypothetical protein PF004_g21584 [Phytophthora fragariae]KAE9277432.1 hypothetical protein PF008_g28858 [Phytophthora fragariae]
MRTIFSFEDDQELVQLARAYLDGGSRVSWTDIARRMRRTGHTAATLQGRLRTLMRTWGRDISRFPPSFFTQVRRRTATRHYTTAARTCNRADLLDIIQGADQCGASAYPRSRQFDGRVAT